MFFLGVSAHMFMYLLFPALIVVWLYFKGIAGNSETMIRVSERVECSYSIPKLVVQIVPCQIKEKLNHKKNVLSIPIACRERLKRYQSIVYIQPILQNQILRAPPIAA